MSRSNIITVAVLIVILMAAAYFAFVKSGGGDKAGSEASRVLTRGEEGALGFTDLEGELLSFETYEGQVRVVNAWASWCPFCVNELPDFAELAREFGDEEVAVIAINRKESNDLAKAFIQSVGPLDGIVFVQDPDDSFYRSIGGFSMPETVFYDKDGNVVFHKRGSMALDEMRKRTEEAIAASRQ